MLRILLGVLIWLALPTAAQAAPGVVAKGLFGGRAILEINGEAHLLKAGERSPEGVLLVSSTSREAVVEIAGVRHTLTLSRQIAGSFSQAQPTTVRVLRDADSHYRVRGAINGRPVTMMVDTGATAVVMNVNDARALGVDYRNGQPSRASTAGGMVDSYVVDLDRVSVGGITVHSVRGAVIIGDFPEQILLGNTFLGRVSMQEEEGVLVLRAKF